MERINNTQIEGGNAIENAAVLENKIKIKITKSFPNYAGIFVGVLIMFAVVVIVTTDIKLTSLSELSALGLDFFLLLFCSYSMCVNCSDSGMRAGYANKAYIDTLGIFNGLKQKIADLKLQRRLADFCRYYIEDELKNARSDILIVVGILYEDYKEKYLALDKKSVDALELSKSQKKAIKKANSLSPLRLTPEMILSSRGASRTVPLGVRPETQRRKFFSTKFITTITTSALMILMAFDIVSEPTWGMIASCAIKLLTVVLNGFSGYKFGFKNIAFDTVNYMNNQSDLLRQAIVYAEANPQTT
jgi:hypothetical protein